MMLHKHFQETTAEEIVRLMVPPPSADEADPGLHDLQPPILIIRRTEEEWHLALVSWTSSLVRLPEGASYRSEHTRWPMQASYFSRPLRDHG